MSQLDVTQSEAFKHAHSQYREGKLADAERLCEQIIAAAPALFDAVYLLGVAQARLGKHEAAVAALNRAIALRPDDAFSHFNRGNAFYELQRYDEALASFDRAVDLRRDFAMAYSNHGNVLQELKRYEEAVESYDRALRLRPRYAVAHYNRGLSLHSLRRCKEAVESYDRAINLRPNFAEARINQSLSRLLIGDFDRGWAGYEWRMDVKTPGNSKRSFVKPQWQGREDPSDKTILLHAEQGFGDTIQFCRYVPLVVERGARVILEVQEPLRELMTSLPCPVQVIGKDSALPDFDIQCPLPSLPLAFRTRLATIPAAVPYLHSSAQSVQQWDARLGQKRRPRIGLVWSGEPTNVNDRNRSIRLSTLLTLLDIGATFVSLQKDVRPEDAVTLRARGDILHFGDDLMSFSDTAALISNLDLVISVDTSVVHLAGALARPVWAMLPYVPDWRWQLDRDDSPWYPTARLFRQDRSRSWDSVLARVLAALEQFVSEQREIAAAASTITA